MRPPLLLIFAAIPLLLAGFSGCNSPRLERSIAEYPRGPQWEPQNVLVAGPIPSGMNRVALLPVFSGGVADLDRNEVNQILHTTAQSANRFEIRVLAPADLAELIGVDQISPQQPFPQSLLQHLAEVMDVQGVLQVQVTHWRPYRPLSVGFRMRLIDLDSRSILWAVDETPDAGTRSVHTSAQIYARTQLHTSYPFADNEAALRSPSRFLTFVSDTLFQTLPKREVVR